MDRLKSSLTTLAVLLAVVVSCMAIAVVAPRHSLFYLASSVMPDTACDGCLVFPNEPRFALVLGY
jgi:hypothetical protein